MKSTSNPTALRTQRAIKNSLKALMANDTFSHITVTEICQEAGVTRQAFYTNFRSKEDVFSSILLEVQREWRMKLPASELSSLYDICVALYQTWRDHSDLLDLIVRDSLISLFVDALLPANFPVRYAAEVPPRKQRQLEPVARMLMTGGVAQALIYWSQTGYRETPEDMALATTSVSVND